jgi:hypothetical protein
MWLLLISTVAVAISLGAAVRADFLITTAAPAARIAAASSPSPTPDNPRRHSLIVAYGFGDRVPLAFAVRQIVPAGIHVTYGPGADRTALVDWRGGRGWNRVLAAAVKPLGLRLVFSRRAVDIRK